jgi:hypothetical protein
MLIAANIIGALLFTGVVTFAITTTLREYFDYLESEQ